MSEHDSPGASGTSWIYLDAWGDELSCDGNSPFNDHCDKTEEIGSEERIFLSLRPYLTLEALFFLFSQPPEMLVGPIDVGSRKRKKDGDIVSPS
jgi:hypothetical protein